MTSNFNLVIASVVFLAVFGKSVLSSADDNEITVINNRPIVGKWSVECGLHV